VSRGVKGCRVAVLHAGDLGHQCRGQKKTTCTKSRLHRNTFAKEEKRCVGDKTNAAATPHPHRRWSLKAKRGPLPVSEILRSTSIFLEGTLPLNENDWNWIENLCGTRYTPPFGVLPYSVANLRGVARRLLAANLRGFAANEGLVATSFLRRFHEPTPERRPDH
jgi:hypothetical protein